MNDENEFEEILLESTEEIGVIDHNSLQNITQKIVQINPWRRQSVSAFVYDDKYLEIKRYDGGTAKHYWLNLMFLNERPVHKRSINWRWVGITLFLAANAALVYSLSAYTQLLKNFAYGTSLSILLFTFTILSVFALIYFSKNQWHFVGRYSGVALLSLMPNKPSPKEFKQFITRLSDNIHQVQAALNAPKQRQLAAELAEHRRLYEEKILDGAAYDQAKEGILHSHA